MYFRVFIIMYFLFESIRAVGFYENFYGFIPY